MDNRDKEILEFLYNRLVYVYLESPNYDYMLNFRRIISEIEKDLAQKDKLS